MNANQLAKQAALSTAGAMRGLLSESVLHKLELAYVAEWLDAQDESIRAKAADTACNAIAILRAQQAAIN